MFSVNVCVIYAINSVGLNSSLQLQCSNTQQSCENELLRKLQLKITSVSLGMPEAGTGFLGGSAEGNP